MGCPKIIGPGTDSAERAGAAPTQNKNKPAEHWNRQIAIQKTSAEGSSRDKFPLGKMKIIGQWENYCAENIQ